MKILLIGEFSSLHKYLKDGLVALGHHVTLAATGDGFKKIKCDIHIESKERGLLGKILTLLSCLKLALSCKQYDVVQLVQPCPFPRKYGINKFLLSIIFKNCKKVFLVGAGATNYNTYIANYYQNYYRYNEFFKILLGNCKENNLLYSQTKEGMDYHNWLHNKISGYIPIMYEYAEPYRIVNYKKLCQTIPIPINIDEIEYLANIPKEKLIIFHGLNRVLSKGTPIIKEALDKIQKNYPNEVEIIIEGKMPLKNYIELMKKTNIIIDQTYSVSSGVNGLIGMAMGKVVLGGGEQECLNEFDLDSCPMIPIEPNPENIYKKLEYLILNKKLIPRIGENSRKYVEKVHNYIDIAKKFETTWLSCI